MNRTSLLFGIVAGALVLAASGLADRGRSPRTTFGPFVVANDDPGACQKRRPHGRTVAAGKKGKFHGYLVGTIRGGTFNPTAVCPSDCGVTDIFIATFFGPDAHFSCEGKSRDCAWSLEYSSGAPKLRFRLWSDKGTGAGTFLKERFYGDIASR